MLKQDFNDLEIGDWCFMSTTGPDGIDRPDSYIGLRFLDGDRGVAILPIATGWPAEAGEKQILNTNGRVAYVNIHGQACWEWDGNKEAPTLTPSILHWGDGRKNPATWHGFLTAGKLITV